MLRATHFWLLVGSAWLAGCSAPLPDTTHASATPAISNDRSRSTARTALADGIELYNRGEFQAAIKHLGNAQDIWSADKSVQLEARKYMAFSYCVTARPVLCRHEFENALKLDPNFDLAPGEKGHPLWGPVFEHLKKTR